MADAVPEPAEVLHLATLSTLQASGFIASSSTAASLLTDTLERYILTLAKRSVARAEINGRNGRSVHALDVEHAIDGLGQGGIDELRDWADELLMGERTVSAVRGQGVEAIGAMVKEGLAMETEPIQYRYMPVPDIKPDSDVASEAEAEEQDEMMETDDSPSSLKRKRSLDDDQDEGYDSGGSYEPERPKPSSDSWLEDWMPRLPGTSTSAIVEIEMELPTPAGQIPADDPMEMASLSNPPVPSTPAAVPDAGPTAASTDSFNRSQLDSYLQPIPYSSSMLKESHPHSQLLLSRPSVRERRALPRSTSSFPALLRVYQETAHDPSMNLSVKPLRQAAAWFLIQGASNPDTYTPPDTLFASPLATLAGPRTCPIVPVHPVPDATGATPPYPLPLLPLDPHPPTFRDLVPHPPPLLSTLVRDLAGQSPFLPRNLRDRLTSLRPPNPLNGAYYGPVIQPPGAPGVNLRATWDSGAGSGRGDFRDGRLPSGRKVVQEKIGHEGPVGIGGAGKVTLRVGTLSPLPAAASAEELEAPPVDQAVAEAVEGDNGGPQEGRQYTEPTAPPITRQSPPNSAEAAEVPPPAEPEKKPGGLKLKLFARPAVSPNAS